MAEFKSERRIEKILTGAGVVPTVPASNNHDDGSWLITDIYEGELCINTTGNKVYTRVGNQIITIGGKSISKTVSFNNGALVLSYDENYSPEYTQTGALSITVNSNTNGAFSSYFVRIVANGDAIDFPESWKRLRYDYEGVAGNFGLAIFYDGIEYQYQLYAIANVDLPPIVEGIVSEYLFSDNYLDTVGSNHMNFAVNTSFTDDRKSEPDSAVSLILTSELEVDPISIGFSDKFSISMWVYLPGSPSTEIGLWDLSKFIANDFISAFMTATGEPRIQVSQNVSGFTNKRYLSDLQMASGWNHIVFVVDGQSILGWLDNVPMTFTKILDDTIVYNDMEGAELLLDGRYQNTDYRAIHHKDDVRISNTAWDASDVTKLYNE